MTTRLLAAVAAALVVAASATAPAAAGTIQRPKASSVDAYPGLRLIPCKAKAPRYGKVTTIQLVRGVWTYVCYAERYDSTPPVH